MYGMLPWRYPDACALDWSCDSWTASPRERTKEEVLPTEATSQDADER